MAVGYVREAGHTSHAENNKLTALVQQRLAIDLSTYHESHGKAGTLSCHAFHACLSCVWASSTETNLLVGVTGDHLGGTWVPSSW